MTKTNSFNGIAEFIAVAQSGGFSAAGRLLGVSTSHISRQVSGLEARLGTVLLLRTTRQVRLTDVGHDYYLKCQTLMNGLNEANEALKEDQVSLEGTLRVSAAGEFVEQYITPALIEFASLHPGLNIDINFNSTLVNLVEQGIDFAIRYGQVNDEGLIARKLINRRLVAGASQAYINHFGLPEHPEDLSHHSCLIANNARWQFSDQGKPIEIKVSGRWRSNNVKALLQATESGLGICYLPQSSFGHLFEQNKLVEVLTPYTNQTLCTWIVYPNQRYLSARARLTIQYLLDSFKDWRD